MRLDVIEVAFVSRGGEFQTSWLVLKKIEVFGRWRSTSSSKFSASHNKLNALSHEAVSKNGLRVFSPSPFTWASIPFRCHRLCLSWVRQGYDEKWYISCSMQRVSTQICLDLCCSYVISRVPAEVWQTSKWGCIIRAIDSTNIVRRVLVMQMQVSDTEFTVLKFEALLCYVESVTSNGSQVVFNLRSRWSRPPCII